MAGEILSRLWTFKIVNVGDTALISLGKVQAKSLSTNLLTLDLADEIGSSFSLALDGGMRTNSISVSGIVHSTNNVAYDLLRDAATGNLGNVTTVKIELSHADMVINGTCLVPTFEQTTGVADFVSFSASLVFVINPTFVALVFGTPLCPTAALVLQTATNEVSFSGVTNRDAFGTYEDIAISKAGDRVVTGAWGFDINPFPDTDVGKIFVYSRSGTTWTLEQSFFPGGTTDPVNFGRSVAINGDGDELAAMRTAAGSEALEFWTRTGTTWTVAQSIVPSSPHQFTGTSIVMDYAGAVCILCSASNANQDKVWVFTKSGGVWSELKVITPSIDTGFSDPLQGFALALSGDGKYLAVGAYATGTDVDIYYVAQGGADNWGLQQTVTEAGAGTSFGYSVSLSCDGSVLAIGEPSDATYGSGSVHIFKRVDSTWTLAATATPTNTGVTYGIGSSCSLSADGLVLLAGATIYNTGQGTVLVLQDQDNDDVWAEQQQIDPAGLSNNDNFGLSCVLSPEGGWAATGMKGPIDTKGRIYMHKVYS